MVREAQSFCHRWSGGWGGPHLWCGRPTLIKAHLVTSVLFLLEAKLGELGEVSSPVDPLQSLQAVRVLLLDQRIDIRSLPFLALGGKFLQFVEKQILDRVHRLALCSESCPDEERSSRRRRPAGKEENSSGQSTRHLF